MKGIPEVEVVPIDLVEANDYNPNEMDTETYNQVVKGIKDEGFLQPILVRKHPEKKGHYLILDGEHRWRGAKDAELKEIPIILADRDDPRARVTTIRMNRLRGDFNPVKLAQNIAELQKHFSEDQLSELIHYKPAELRDYLKLLKLPPDVAEAIAQSVEAEKKMLPEVMVFVLSKEEASEVERILGTTGKKKTEALMEICRFYGERVRQNGPEGAEAESPA